jgi:hypothetical protein
MIEVWASRSVVIGSSDNSSGSLNVEIFHVEVVHLGLEVFGKSRRSGAPVKARTIAWRTRGRSRSARRVEAPRSIVRFTS